MKMIYLISLLTINFLLFLKLDFFLPQLTGNSSLYDFETYIKLSKIILKGGNPYISEVPPTLGPPTVFFYYLPFLVFRPKFSVFIHTLVNIAAGLACCFLLYKKYFQKIGLVSFLLLTFIFFSSFPIRFSIEMGQPNLIIGFLITLIIVSSKTKFANSILALICLIKANYLLSLISFLKIKKGLVIKTVLTILFFIIIFFPIVKPSLYLFYIRKGKPKITFYSESPKTLDYYNQSIPSRLQALKFGKLSFLIYTFLTIFLIISTYKSKNILRGFLSSVILSPISWQHYYAALFPIYILVFVKTKNHLNKSLWYISFVLFWVEFPFLHNLSPNIFTSLLSSHYLLSSLLLFYLARSTKVLTPTKDQVKYVKYVK